MPHSSISSSDQGFESWRRVLTSRMSVCLIIVVLVLEVCVRLSVPSGARPVGGFHTPELRTKVDQHRALESVDVLVTGSSVAAANYNMQSMGAALREAGLSATAFNAGIRGCDYTCVGPLVEKLFLAEALAPKLLVLVISPIDLNEASPYVRARSLAYVDTLQRSAFKRTIEDLLSSAYWTFGFREELSDFIGTGSFRYEDLVEQAGYVNMGSVSREWQMPKLRFEAEGAAFTALQLLIDVAANRGTVVALHPVFGAELFSKAIPATQLDAFGSMMEMLLSGSSALLLTDMPNAEEHVYIDNVHVNTATAKTFGKRLGTALAGHSQAKSALSQ